MSLVSMVGIAAAALAIVVSGSTALAGSIEVDGIRRPDTKPLEEAGYQRVELLDHAETELRSVVNAAVLAPLAASLGRKDPMPGLIGTFDVDGDHVDELVVHVLDVGQCGDGCRTMVYRHNGVTWVKIFEGMAIDIYARPGSFAAIRMDKPLRVLVWDADKRRFAERATP